MREVGTPFAEFHTEVRAEWLDYNGHMNDSGYAVVLSLANERVLEALGLSADYRERSGAALYTVESHLRYLAECTLGQTLGARSLLVAADARKLRLHTELRHDDGRVAATGEYLYLHVDPALGGTAPMAAEQLALVERMLADHAALPRPAHLGRGVGAPRPRPTPADGESSRA